MTTASSVLATLPTLVVGWPQVSAKGFEPKGSSLPRLISLENRAVVVPASPGNSTVPSCSRDQSSWDYFWYLVRIALARCAMSLAHVSEVDLYYEIHGDGFPLLMINGFGSNTEMWSPFWRRLAKSYRVILFDNRGVGQSTVPAAPFTVRDMAEDAAALLDALGVPRSLVYGASMGGMIAQELVLAHPDRVRGLLLGMTSCGGPHSVPMAVGSMQGTMAPGATPAQMAEGRLRLMHSEAYFAEHRDELLRQALSVQHPTTLQGYRLQGMATLKFDTYDRLPQIRTPTLVMAGSADAIIPAENARIIASRIPGAQLRIFEGAGHAFTRECEDDAVEAMLSFLEQVMRRSG